MATHSKGSSVTKSISMEPELLRQVAERIASLKIRNFSEYFRKLAEQYLAEQGAITYSPTATVRPQEHNGNTPNKKDKRPKRKVA